MGMTAPALYRYVGSYQELVDLVAFEIDKAATDEFRAAAATQPDDDPMAQLVCAAVAFRRWALRDTAEFSLVFANPVAESHCHRREMLTAWTSGLYFHELLVAVWHETHFDHPDLDDLDPVVAESLRAPLFPVDVTLIPPDHLGLLWVFMRAWATLYGTVTLEVFGHMDPRVIESGTLFATMLGEWLPRLGGRRPRRPLPVPAPRRDRPLSLRRRTDHRCHGAPRRRLRCEGRPGLSLETPAPTQGVSRRRTTPTHRPASLTGVSRLVAGAPRTSTSGAGRPPVGG